VLWSWDGERLTERELGPGLHIVVNSGLASDLLAAGAPGAGSPPASTGPGTVVRDEEMARLAHFLPRFAAAARPDPRPGTTVTQAWGDWLPLVNGDGIGPGDPRALIVRHDLGGGRTWGATSVSLVAVQPEESPDAVRYDFTATPGDPDAWYEVPAQSPTVP
jgi:hypothetical protein